MKKELGGISAVLLRFILCLTAVILIVSVMLFSGCDDKKEGEIGFSTVEGTYFSIKNTVTESDLPGNDSGKLAQSRDSERNVSINGHYRLYSDHDDTIQITYSEDAYGYVNTTKAVLTVNEHSVDFFMSKCAGADIVELDRGNNVKAIIVYEESTDGKYISIFTYDGAKVYNLGKLCGNEYDEILTDGMGNFIDGSTCVDFVEPVIATAYFNIKDNKFDRIEVDCSHVFNQKYKVTRDICISFIETELEEIGMDTQFDKENISYIKKGEEIVLIGAYTKGEKYCATLQDGRKGIFLILS